jgi:hypothetical protein
MAPIVREERVEGGRWTPAGVLALVAALVYGVLGIVGFIRAGLDPPWDTPEVTVGWLSHTAWLAFGHVALALMLAAAGSAAGRDRSGITFVSAILIVAGLVVVIEPTAFSSVLATTMDHGLTWLVTGAALLGAALFSPTIRHEERVITDVR